MRRFPVLLLVFCAALFAEVTDAGYARLREAALARPRRVIIDNDGCDVSAFPEGREVSLENITNYFNAKVLGYEIDAISYCPGCTAFKMTHRSKVADLNYNKMHVSGLRNLTEWVHEQGTDGLEMASRFARENGLEIFANMRINDLHDRWAPQSNYAPFMMAHLDWLVGRRESAPPFGSWLQFNFAIPQVRERFLAIVTEMLEYDVDGLIVDFCRYPVLFPSVGRGEDASDGERAIVTELVRQLRALTDRVGKEKGRYQMLMIKVPDGMEINRAVGIDVARICDEKLIDILIVGSDIGRSEPYVEAVRMGQDHGVMTYLSVEAWNGANPLSKDSVELYQGQAAAAWHAKPDGLFYFNFFYHSSKFDAIRYRPESLFMTEKSYWGRHHSRPNYAAACARYAQLDAVDGTGLALSADADAHVLLETGDEFGNAEVAARKPSVQLVVHTVPGLPELRASLNGTPLAAPLVFARKQVFQVPFEAVKAGANDVTLRLTRPFAPPMATLFRGDSIIRYSSAFPWRRLWPFYRQNETERVVDGAMRLNDFGSEPGQCVNFYYPVSSTAANLAGAFEMKVEATDAPEAVVFRVADGRKAELVTFEPNRVSFRFSGKSAEFVTDDAFHAYEWDIGEGEVLTLKADGRTLLQAPMAMDADDPRARFTGNNDGLPYMYERSLVIGSLSEAGQGASLWKNFKYTDGACVQGTELQVKFTRDSFESLLTALGKAPAPLLRYDASEGALPMAGTWGVSYEEGRLKLSSEGTLLIDNSSGENACATMTWQIPPELRQPGRVAVVEWESRVRECAGSFGFMLGIRIDSPADGKRRNVAVMQGTGFVRVGGASTELPADGYARCQLFAEVDTGRYVLKVNGQVLEMDTMGETTAPPLLFLGDGSTSCDGLAELRRVSVGVI